jgi:hypothetical protein
MKTNTPRSAVRNVARIGRWIAPVAVTMLSGAAFAQSAQPVYVPSPGTAAPAYVQSPAYRLSDVQLDQLTGPIALYPDPLIAAILPAATYPSEVQSAAGWVQSSGVQAQEAIDAQPWEGSVKTLVHYPTVLQMMAGRMDWTQQLGSAYLNQPDDVMNSIQRLRGIAQGNGALYSSPQEQVVVSDNLISIVPADPQVIYVPEYDPAVVFVRGGHVGHDVVRFGAQYHGGVWLNYDTDWNHHYIVEGRRWDQREHVDVHARDVHPDVHVEARPTVQAEPHRWVRNDAKPMPAPRADVGRNNVREEQARPAAHTEAPPAHAADNHDNADGHDNRR